jgi:protocatechuate 3,4-dioxygenase alpha subunit
MLKLSPYGTIGPFFPTAFCDDANDLTRSGTLIAKGQHILLTGRVLEQGAAPTRNSIVEIWQADAVGLFRHPLDPRAAEADPGFAGWGRAATNQQGWYKIRTVLPGVYSDPTEGTRCPHIDVMILAIGLTRRLVTTAFFANAADPVLDCVDADRRTRLIPVRDASLDENGAHAYRFDIILRGDAETPFFVD